MGRPAACIELSTEERSDLERLIRKCSTPQQIALRARMIVRCADGYTITQTAEHLGVWRKTVSQWRARRLLDCNGSAMERLSDAPRSGVEARITPEQICSIIALACERPSECGLPFSHWSQQALADEAMRRGIVDQISQRSVGRFLKRI